MVVSLRSLLLEQRPHTSLGRWCLSSSEFYRDRCAWAHKVHYANEDCGPHPITKPDAAPLHCGDTPPDEEEFYRMALLSDIHSPRRNK